LSVLLFRIRELWNGFKRGIEGLVTRVWHDPVGANVVAGLITAAILTAFGFAGLWLTKRFSKPTHEPQRVVADDSIRTGGMPNAPQSLPRKPKRATTEDESKALQAQYQRLRSELATRTRVLWDSLSADSGLVPKPVRLPAEYGRTQRALERFMNPRDSFTSGLEGALTASIYSGLAQASEEDFRRFKYLQCYMTPDGRDIQIGSSRYNGDSAAAPDTVLAMFRDPNSRFAVQVPLRDMLRQVGAYP
jgi:hypothetical protein